MTATSDLAVRFNHAGPEDGVDRTDHVAPLVPRPTVAAPVIDRTLHQGAPHVVIPRPASPRAPEPPREGPQNVHELNVLLGERSRAAAAQSDSPLPLASSTRSALAALDAAHGKPAGAVSALEAEARRNLRDAINVRAGAREAVAAQETALSKAREVEHDAIVAESRGRLAELDGGDALARQIVDWAARGGDKPDLAPDAASLDARHARDRARVHADAARQAVAAIGEALQAKRHALTGAEIAVTAAARGVVEAVAEDIATEGRKAGVIHRRAELAALALQRMTRNGIGAVPLYALKPETRGLADDFTGHRKNEPVNLLDGAASTWRAFQTALEADADAALA